MMISGTVVKRLVENASDASVIVWQKPECHAVITGAAEGLGMQSRAMDSGGKAHMRVRKDCSATTAIAWRRVLGSLWLLELTWSRRVKVK